MSTSSWPDSSRTVASPAKIAVGDDTWWRVVLRMPPTITAWSEPDGVVSRINKLRIVIATCQNIQTRDIKKKSPFRIGAGWGSSPTSQASVWATTPSAALRLASPKFSWCRSHPSSRGAEYVLTLPPTNHNSIHDNPEPFSNHHHHSLILWQLHCIDQFALCAYDRRSGHHLLMSPLGWQPTQ